jgi:hypothetical protein
VISAAFIAFGKSFKRENNSDKFKKRCKLNSPVYWQISKVQLLVIHLPPTYVGVHHELHPHVLDRYYRQRKSNLEYFENNVSIMVEFYPKK